MTDYEKIYDRALDLLSRRDHSKKELKDKLFRKFGGENLPVIDEVCTELERISLLDDERFARVYTEELIRRKRMSPSGIRSSLIAKGIDRDIISTVIEEADIDIKASINYLLDTKYRGCDLNEEHHRNKIFNALLRLGYSYNDVKSVFYARTNI